MPVAKKAVKPKAKAKVAGGVAISCHKTKKAAQTAAGKAADKSPVKIVKSEGGYCVEAVKAISGTKPKAKVSAKPKAAKPTAAKKKTAVAGKKRKAAGRPKKR